jgi:hypothetical protein
VSGISLFRASTHHARVFDGAQGGRDHGVFRLGVMALTAKKAANLRISA